MSNEKQFFGSVKKQTTQYGEMTKISFNQKDIDNMKANLNDKGYVNMVVKESKGKPGTFYLELDTWQPKAGSQSTASNNSNDNDWNPPF
jgi:hypothetical protein